MRVSLGSVERAVAVGRVVNVWERVVRVLGGERVEQWEEDGWDIWGGRWGGGRGRGRGCLGRAGLSELYYMTKRGKK